MSIDLDKAKQELEALSLEYRKRIEKITNHMLNPQSSLQEHWDDQAVVTSQNDMRHNLKADAEEGLALVNAALARIEEGEYGICTECGEEINTNRLDAVPYATECIKHAD